MLGARRPGRATFSLAFTVALAAAACGGSVTAEPPGASGAGGAVGVGGTAGAAGAGGSGGIGGIGGVTDASTAGDAFTGVTDAANDPNDAQAAADVANDAPPVDALPDAAADVRDAWPPGATVADIFYGHTFTYWAAREWIRSTSTSVPPTDADLVPIVPEPHFTVRFSADGASITLDPVADAGVPAMSALLGTRTETTVISATYLITTATGGNFVASINAFPAAAAVTIYGSGLPVIYATRGELRD